MKVSFGHFFKVAFSVCDDIEVVGDDIEVVGCEVVEFRLF